MSKHYWSLFRNVWLSARYCVSGESSHQAICPHFSIMKGVCLAKVDLQNSYNCVLMVDRKNQKRRCAELPANLGLNPRVRLGILNPQNLRLTFTLCARTEYGRQTTSDFCAGTSTYGTVNKL